MKMLLDIIYHKLPRLHKCLMKNKYYFRYRHILWNYGSYKAYIKHLEWETDWMKKHYKYDSTTL